MRPEIVAPSDSRPAPVLRAEGLLSLHEGRRGGVTGELIIKHRVNRLK